MKKWHKILAIGACIALGAAGMVACGDPEDGGDPGANNCVYYLAGKSLGDVFHVEVDGEETSRDWYEKYTAIADIPDSIHFANTDTANVYTLTANLYKSDEFGILTVNKGWGDQIGGDKLDPLTEDINENISSQDNGVGGRNFHVGVAGNYTITLDTRDGIKVSYVRNGDPTVEIHVDYNYYIKGDKVTGGNTMYVDYTKFAANEAKNEYKLEIGMQEGDLFNFAAIMEQDNDQKPEYLSTDFTLAGDDTETLIEVEKKTPEGEEEEKPTGKFKMKATGTYEFKITEDEEDNLTLAVTKKAETVPAYDYYVVTADKEGDDITAQKVIPMTEQDG